MENEIYSKFKDYLNEIDTEEISLIWEKQSNYFKNFWKNKILNVSSEPLSDSEIDEIVLILDVHAKGSTKDTIAVARTMIPQGVWRRLFKEIQNNTELKVLLNEIFTETDVYKQMELIDKLYEFNKGQKNSLTGISGTAINAMLFAYNPTKYINVVSLKDRKRVIEHYNLDYKGDFERDSQGKKIVESNYAILNGFKKYNIETYPFILSWFLYDKIKDEWKIPVENKIGSQGEVGKDEKYLESDSRFYMEKELENFLITNWDNTELATEYELIVEDGEIKSQQYPTDIGVIDILVRDKQTGRYVVIELKKNQTSDDTIGQISRYMGWLEEHKTRGEPAKGIIIASAYDKKLYYALKKVKDVEVYTYQVDFKLREFKKEPT